MLSTSERIDPRAKRTREALQAAFLALLSERGLRSLTVQDITAQAGVNRATFYAHYLDKYDMFSQLIREQLSDTLSQHSANPLIFNADGLRTQVVAACTFMTNVYAGCHVHDDDMEVHIEQQVQLRLGECLLEGLKDCVQAPNSRIITKEMTATLTASCIYAAAAVWGAGRTSGKLDDYVSEVMVFVMGAVSACGYGLPTPAA